MSLRNMQSMRRLPVGDRTRSGVRIDALAAMEAPAEPPKPEEPETKVSETEDSKPEEHPRHSKKHTSHKHGSKKHTKRSVSRERPPVVHEGFSDGEFGIEDLEFEESLEALAERKWESSKHDDPEYDSDSYFTEEHRDDDYVMNVSLINELFNLDGKKSHEEDVRDVNSIVLVHQYFMDSVQFVKELLDIYKTPERVVLSGETLSELTVRKVKCRVLRILLIFAKMWYDLGPDVDKCFGLLIQFLADVAIDNHPTFSREFVRRANLCIMDICGATTWALRDAPPDVTAAVMMASQRYDQIEWRLSDDSLIGTAQRTAHRNTVSLDETGGPIANSKGRSSIPDMRDEPAHPADFIRRKSALGQTPSKANPGPRRIIPDEVRDSIAVRKLSLHPQDVAKVLIFARNVDKSSAQLNKDTLRTFVIIQDDTSSTKQKVGNASVPHSFIAFNMVDKVQEAFGAERELVSSMFAEFFKDGELKAVRSDVKEFKTGDFAYYFPDVKGQDGWFPDSRESNPKKSHPLLSFSPVEFARQLTLLDHENISKLPLWELSQGRFEKSDRRPDLVPNVANYNDFSNSVSIWLVAEIMKEKDVNKRARIIERLYKVFLELKKIGNDTGAREVMGALTNPALNRLKETRALIKDEIKQALEQCEIEMTSTKMNLDYDKTNLNQPYLPNMFNFLRHLMMKEGQGETKMDLFGDTRISMFNKPKLMAIAKSFNLIMAVRDMVMPFKSVPAILEYINRSVEPIIEEKPDLYELAKQCEPR